MFARFLFGASKDLPSSCLGVLQDTCGAFGLSRHSSLLRGRAALAAATILSPTVASTPASVALPSASGSALAAATTTTGSGTTSLLIPFVRERFPALAASSFQLTTRSSLGTALLGGY